MGRGLSEQQRRVLIAAHAAYRDAAARNRQAESNHRYLAARLDGVELLGPLMPIAHLTRSDALHALHGWRGGRKQDNYWQQARDIPGETLRVFTGHNVLTTVATINRAEYEVAQASTSRTLARLVARGLLRPHGYYQGYNITAAGLQAIAAFTLGLAKGENDEAHYG